MLQSEVPGPVPAPPPDHPARGAGAELRVLHVLAELRLSGAEVMLASAADEWRAHGISVSVLAAAGREGSFAGQLQAGGVQVIHVRDRPLALLPARFAGVLRRMAPDVVHLHTERANFWLAAIARLTGRRVVRTVHAGFDFHGALRVRRRIQRRLLAAAGTATVSVSREVATNERRRFDNPSRLIENWIDDRRFTPRRPGDRAEARARLGLSPDDRVLVSVGNCAVVKRHDLVLAALPALSRRWNRMVYLHLGEEDPAAGERQLARREKVADLVRFLGPGDPLPVLRAADVFVMPSRREGLGLACAEALAVGVPAVVTDAPGLRLFGEYTDLVRVAPARPADLADAIADLLSHPPEAMQVAAVSAAIRRRFGVRRGVEEYVAQYRRADIGLPGGASNTVASSTRASG